MLAFQEPYSAKAGEDLGIRATVVSKSSFILGLVSRLSVVSRSEL